MPGVRQVLPTLGQREGRLPAGEHMGCASVPLVPLPVVYIRRHVHHSPPSKGAAGRHLAALCAADSRPGHGRPDSPDDCPATALFDIRVVRGITKRAEGIACMHHSFTFTYTVYDIRMRLFVLPSDAQPLNHPTPPQRLNPAQVLNQTLAQLHSGLHASSGEQPA